LSISKESNGDEDIDEDADEDVSAIFEGEILFSFVLDIVEMAGEQHGVTGALITVNVSAEASRSA